MNIGLILFVPLNPGTSGYIHFSPRRGPQPRGRLIGQKELVMNTRRESGLPARGTNPIP